MTKTKKKAARAHGPSREDEATVLEALRTIGEISERVAIGHDPKFGAEAAQRSARLLRNMHTGLPDSGETMGKRIEEDFEMAAIWQMAVALDRAQRVTPPGLHSLQVVRLSRWIIGLSKAFANNPDDREMFAVAWERFAEGHQREMREISVRHPNLADLVRDEYRRFGAAADWKASPVQQAIVAALRKHGPLRMPELFALTPNKKCELRAFQYHVSELVQHDAVLMFGTSKGATYSAPS